MTSGNYKCETELSITDIEEVEIEQIACGSYFVDIKDILNKEIVKEEATDVKTCSVYGNEQNANINQFGAVPILKRGIVEGDPTETKAFDFCENIDHNGLAGALAKSKVKKDDDHPECSNNPSANDAEWKLETFKREDDINIIYKDVKHGICEEKSSEKKENVSCMNSVAEILTETKIEPYSSYELPICSELWPQQNIEEDETAVESYNDTRKEPTITLNSRNCQKFQEFSHRKYSNCYSFQPKQELKKLNYSGEKPFKCEFCSKKFASKITLVRHEKVHRSENPFKCKICSMSFAEEKKLLKHLLKNCR